MYQFRSVTVDAVPSRPKTWRRVGAGLIPATLVFLGGGLWVAQLAGWVESSLLGASIASSPVLVNLALASYGLGILLSCINLWLLLGARSARNAASAEPLAASSALVTEDGVRIDRPSLRADMPWREVAVVSAVEGSVAFIAGDGTGCVLPAHVVGTREDVDRLRTLTALRTAQTA